MYRTTLTSAACALSLITTINCTAPAPQSSSSSELFGTWSNVSVSEGEDPHAYGIEVELWNHHGDVSGFLTEWVGPVADPPVGRLESIVFDEKTGTISFDAKLSVGVVSGRDGTWTPAKNRYEFNGVIDNSAMTGSLRRKLIHDNGTETTAEETISLNNRSAAERTRPVGESYEEWNDRWHEVLKLRGPKW